MIVRSAERSIKGVPMDNQRQMNVVPNTPYVYDARLEPSLTALRERVSTFRTLNRTLSQEAMLALRDYFRLKTVYNSNGIEGNQLTIGETKLVIQEGLTITGKPLKDSVEAKNLADALDYFEELAQREGEPLTEHDVRQIHQLILKDIDSRIAGNYRSVFVKISGSSFTPPDPARIAEMMAEFGAWLGSHSVPRVDLDPVIAACVAHAWFVYIHPFQDGNGRTARILLNLLLIRNGYPLSIVTKDDRQRYYNALETSQEGGDLTPFIQLVLETIEESIIIYEQAASGRLQLDKHVAALVDTQFSESWRAYSVFIAAMELLRSQFAQAIHTIDHQRAVDGTEPWVSHLFFLYELEHSRFLDLQQGLQSRPTWFFQVMVGDEQAVSSRYLFWFDRSSAALREAGVTPVTLHIALSSGYDELLADRDPSELPSTVEIGYLPQQETFVVLDRSKQARKMTGLAIATEFIMQAVKRESNNS